MCIRDSFDTNPTGKRSAGKPPATFDEAGTGDVAWLRYRGTRRRKSEQQRTQTSTYTGAPVLDSTDERRLETESGCVDCDTARRKVRQRTTRTYDHRATSRLYRHRALIP